jgi:hypothetical protein
MKPQTAKQQPTTNNQQTTTNMYDPGTHFETRYPSMYTGNDDTKLHQDMLYPIPARA